MYQVFRDGLTFYVSEEEKAKKYAEEGYDVFLVDKLRMNEQGELVKDEAEVSVMGFGSSEELPKAVAKIIGG